MTDSCFEQLQSILVEQGGPAAIEQLCMTLRERQDYASLFYALLMKKRFDLGVSPVPTELAQTMPAAAHAAYEEGIRDAAREVGGLYLGAGQIPRAWVYFRMIGEPDPVAAALELYKPDDSEESQQIIEIAFHQGVNPRLGFDWLLERYGICSAITTAGSHDFSSAPETRTYCIQKLVRALHTELRERIAADVANREGSAPVARSVAELIAGRDWLFADEFYHVDVSHLSSVVQMSLQLPSCPELKLARELCAYGMHLSTRFQHGGDPPFENLYQDCGIYLAILDGDQVEEGLTHFRAKVAAMDPENDGTIAVEVFVNLLAKLGRLEEALDVARQHLARVSDRPLNCPSITELCQRTGKYEVLAEVAREQGDPVHFLAGLLAGRRAEAMIAGSSLTKAASPSK